MPTKQEQVVKAAERVNTATTELKNAETEADVLRQDCNAKYAANVVRLDTAKNELTAANAALHSAVEAMKT